MSIGRSEIKATILSKRKRAAPLLRYGSKDAAHAYGLWRGGGSVAPSLTPRGSGNILYKRLHSLVAGESEVVVELRGVVVAIFRTLPEQSLVVAEERRTLHL